jgi:hypothetical protein
MENRRQKKDNVAVIGHYYSVARDGKRHQEIEDDLEKIESLALPLIGDFADGKEVTNRSKSIFAIYAALQWLRVPDFQRTVERITEEQVHKEHPTSQLVKQVLEDLIKEHGPLDIDPDNWSRTITVEKIEVRVDREFSLGAMKQNTPKLANFLASVNWAILHVEGQAKFITCDNPLVLLAPHLPGGSQFDFTTPNCLKFMPLTPRCALLMGDKGTIARHVRTPDAVVEDFNRHIARQLRRFLFAQDLESLAKVANLGDHANRTRDGRLGTK